MYMGKGVRCSVCRGTATAHLRCESDTLSRCNTCRLIFLNAARDTQKIFSYYQDEFYDAQGERFNMFVERLVLFFRYVRYRKIIAAARQRNLHAGKILDVGFSRGYVLQMLKRKGWKSYGINVSHNVVAHAKSQGLTAIEGELPKVTFPYASFDVITFWHVLEHVPEPDQYVKMCSRIIKPKGFMIIEVPNSDSIPARLFRCNWLALDLPRHLSHFTPASLSYLLNKHGFRVEKIEFFSLEHSTFSLLQSMLNTVMGKNELLNSLKKHAKASLGKKIVYGLCALILLPVAFLCAVLFALLKQGDIMRVYCTKTS